jgi:hypothetical protein
MGNWTIVIHGTGQHHNNHDPSDADVLAVEMVEMVLRAGHRLDYADFTSGARLPLFPSAEQPAQPTAQ